MKMEDQYCLLLQRDTSKARKIIIWIQIAIGWAQESVHYVEVKNIPFTSELRLYFSRHYAKHFYKR